jgi:hypothetical protein
MPRKMRNTLLIVCEGAVTEPAYLEWYRKQRLGSWDKIVLYPDAIGNPKPDQHETRRKTKRFKTGQSQGTEDRFNAYLLAMDIGGVYDEYKAEPVRLVAEAKIRQNEEGFNEAWAVFDEDGRNPGNLQKAFRLAPSGQAIKTADEKVIADGEVKIAFSSRSFEHWLLLHFEKNNKAFSETECGEYEGKGRKRTKHLYDCGRNSHRKDCGGLTCLVGRLRHLGHDFDKSQDPAVHHLWMEEIAKRQETAFENAAWLRYAMKKALPNAEVWELKPYTDMDRLLKSMLGISKAHVCQDEGPCELEGFDGLRIERQGPREVRCTFNDARQHPQSSGFEVLFANGTRQTLSVAEESFEAIRNQGFFSLPAGDDLAGAVLQVTTEHQVIWVVLSR